MPDTDWKQRYFDVLAEHEQAEAAWKAREEMLGFAVNRLSLLGQGLDARLDPHLESLRAGLRRGDSTERLRAEAGRLADLLDELRRLGHAGRDDELLHLLELLRLPPSRRKALDPLAVRVRQTQPPRGELIEAIAAELNHILLDPSRAPLAAGLPAPGSLAGEDIDGAAPEAEPERSGRTLTDLLAALRLPWTPELELARETLRQRLAQPVPAAAWPQAIEAGAELLNRALAALGGEREELHGFIALVTERLAGLERYVAGERDDLSQARGGSAAFGAAFEAGMHELRSGVGSADGLAALKRTVLGHVERLDHALQSFRAEEEQRLSEFGTRIESLSEQISRLGGETHALRSALVDRDQRLRRDPLTGIGNRRAWDEALAAAVERWLAHGRPLTLAVWDIDWFKRINDRLGHAAGDRVLTGVAHLLAGSLRAEDTLARYGGEEFALLLPATPPDEALQICERIRAAIATSEFAVEGGSVPVTVSCGLTGFRPGDGVRSAFARADAALYAAKRGGRNRCVMAES